MIGAGAIQLLYGSNLDEPDAGLKECLKGLAGKS